MFGKWFKKKPDRVPAARFEPSFRFLYEPDGESFRQFRSAVTPTLAQFGSIRSAYVALVVFNDPSHPNVVLCLAAPENPRVVSAVGQVFRRMFAASQQLDIMFLNDEQEAEVAAVCHPFFVGE